MMLHSPLSAIVPSCAVPDLETHDLPASQGELPYVSNSVVARLEGGPGVAAGKSDITVEEAREIDHLINVKVEELKAVNGKVTSDLLDLLRAINECEGYACLGFKKLTNYLATKDLSASSRALLLRLTLAGDLSPFFERGLRPWMLMEYARHTDFAEKVPQLILQTMETVERMSIREARAYLKAFVVARESEYLTSRSIERRKEARSEARGKAGEPPSSPWKDRLAKQAAGMSSHERLSFVRGMREFLADCQR